MQNVIVIGSSGFLGSAVTRELIACGFHVHAIQNQRPLSTESGLTIIPGGIKSLTTNTLDRIRPAAIFHCARPVFPHLRHLGRLVAAWQANRFNRRLLSQIVASQDQPPLVFASGSLVYGNNTQPHNELSPLKPLSYARQYHRGENPLVDAIRNNNTKVIMLRFPWILGQGSWFSWFYQKSLMEKGKVPLFGNGSNMMSLISLEDAARLMVRSYTRNLESRVYNVFSPHMLSQKDFAGLVAAHGGGTLADYLEIFPEGVEKAAMEAFTSNILLRTDHPEWLEGYNFQDLNQVLRELFPVAPAKH